MSDKTEEMAVAYAKKLHLVEFAPNKVFKDNFFNDWKNNMSSDEKDRIVDIEKCDFTQIYEHVSKLGTKLPETWNETDQAHGFCTIDGKRTEIGNYKMEPPGIYRSNTSKRGKWKKRIQPKDVTINCNKCSNDYKPPGEHQCSEGCNPKPPEGHDWALVRKQSVSWLAKWQHPITGSPIYMQMSPSSELKGEEDRQKFNTAIELGTHIERIRRKYREEWKSEDPKTKQLSIAVYLIDKFAFRAGGEKDKDAADTVGCCSLRVKHLKFHDELVVEFDFPGKASIRYKKKHKIDLGVFVGLRSLAIGKESTDLIFDQLSTDEVNTYLNKYMDKLTAKVFRTFRASQMMEVNLLKTRSYMNLEEKLEIFHTANLKVAKLCNHLRIPSTNQLKKEIFDTKRANDMAEQMKQEKIKKIRKEISEKTKTPLPAKDTSKKHYIDPRVVAAWCYTFDVPIHEIYSESLQDKFRWAKNPKLKNWIFYVVPLKQMCHLSILLMPN